MTGSGINPDGSDTDIGYIPPGKRRAPKPEKPKAQPQPATLAEAKAVATRSATLPGVHAEPGGPHTPGHLLGPGGPFGPGGPEGPGGLSNDRSQEIGLVETE